MTNFCPECGKQRINNSNFCVYCGFNFQVLDNIHKQNTNNIHQNTQQNINRPNIQQNYANSNTQQDFSNIPQQNYNQPPNITKNCPSCHKQLNIIQKEGMLSGGEYLYCNDCNIEFRKTGDKYSLNNAPENTRAKSTLQFKQFTLEEWDNIFSNNNLSPDEIEKLSKYNNQGITQITCPICNLNMVNFVKMGVLSQSNLFLCEKCKLTLEKHDTKFTFQNIAINNTPLWKYKNQELTLEEIKRINDGGLSDKEIEESNKQIYKNTENSDIELFKNTLSTDLSILPEVNNVTVILKNNEKPIIKLEYITLSEPRAVRTSTGGYGGTSVRVAKGVTLHSGSTRGKSESHDEIKEIDHGELIITNKRIIFLGSNRTTNIDINKIVSIENNGDEIKIQRSNKQKPEYFKGIKHNAIQFTIEGRQRTLNYDGEMVKQIILKQIQ